MDEATTRLKKIDPALRNVGWDEVPQSEILVEQSAYIAPGMVSALAQNRHPKKADYILEYKKKKLAVIEAKSDEKSYAEGTSHIIRIHQHNALAPATAAQPIMGHLDLRKEVTCDVSSC